MKFGTFFLPGPTDVRPEILQAMAGPMISHRGPAFEDLFRSIQNGLQQVFLTRRPVYVSTSSATGLMEAGVRCAPAGPVLSLVNGAFSDRFSVIAAACGRQVDRYEVAWGEVHNPVALAARLAEKRYAAITVVHSETSTGARNDIRTLATVARQHGAIALVDSVSGVAGAELRFDDWELDYALTGSQKALALPPGLAFAVASESFIDHARQATGKGVYFDLVEHDQATRKFQTPSTPAISLYFALARQLGDIVREGMPTRWARHETMRRQTEQWVLDTGNALDLDLHILALDGHRSPTVSTIVLPIDIDATAFVDAVARRGFTMGTGYGKLKATTFRVGHMGDHTPEGLQRCLDACAEALGELRTSV